MKDRRLEERHKRAKKWKRTDVFRMCVEGVFGSLNRIVNDLFHLLYTSYVSFLLSINSSENFSNNSSTFGTRVKNFISLARMAHTYTHARKHRVCCSLSELMALIQWIDYYSEVGFQFSQLYRTSWTRTMANHVTAYCTATRHESKKNLFPISVAFLHVCYDVHARMRVYVSCRW